MSKQALERLEQLKQQKLSALQEASLAREGLPHIYGFRDYRWSKEFLDSRNKLLFLTAGNQLGKSSTQIRKMIHWATSPKLWPSLWPTRPLMFWYLYPSLKVATIECKKKWEPEFLPRGSFKQHPTYGWRFETEGDIINAIHFNSGVSIYFKSYMTQETLLQTGSCHYLGFDEEMPEMLWPELVMRVTATQGYISGVFTPTLSQQFWYEVMEKRGHSDERFPTAHKITASLFDSTEYFDGTPSAWTRERITQVMNSLPTDDEINRRVFGRFIMNKTGLKYPSFSRNKNVKPPIEIPNDWLWYAGIDSGSGGENHPCAISFVAVKPDFTFGKVVEVWRGTKENLEAVGLDFTTAGDILDLYLRFKGKRNIVSARFDWADKDLGLIAERNNVYLEKAEKSHEHGEGLLNTLFKNCMLDVDDTEMNKGFVGELVSLRKDTNKRKAKDDGIDSVRYAVASIPWDLSKISDQHLIHPEISNRYALGVYNQHDRSQHFHEDLKPKNEDIEKEIEEWNEYY